MGRPFPKIVPSHWGIRATSSTWFPRSVTIGRIYVRTSLLRCGPKIEKSPYLVIVLQIATKFGKVTHIDPLHPIGIKIANFLKFNMANGRHVENGKIAISP